MGKIIIRLLLAGFILCSGHYSFSQTALSSQRRVVVRTYTAQLGVRELSGNNDGKDVEKYLKTVGLGKGYAWCAAFVKWCLLSSGVREARVVTGAAASLYRRDHLVYDKGRWYAEPLPADVFTMYYRNLGRIGHTGFFSGWANRSMATFVTVEGNTNGGGSRDGDGCYRRIRQVGSGVAFSRWVQ